MPVYRLGEASGVSDGTRTHNAQIHNLVHHHCATLTARHYVILREGRKALLYFPARYGAPGRTRTCGPQLRRLLLYPPELRAQFKGPGQSALPSRPARNPSPTWSGREDLNLRHPAPKAGALPGCATPRSEGKYIHQLSNNVNSFRRKSISRRGQSFPGK